MKIMEIELRVREKGKFGLTSLNHKYPVIIVTCEIVVCVAPVSIRINYNKGALFKKVYLLLMMTTTITS